MQLATVFSGIGAPEQACRKIYGVNGFNIVFACDNGEIEIPQTYEQILELIKIKQMTMHKISFPKFIL